MTDLNEVRLLADRYKKAQIDLRAGVRAAREAGASVADIAAAAGVTRQSIYRWIQTDNDSINVQEAVTDALILLCGGLVPDSTAAHLHPRIGSKDIRVLLNGLRLGAANLLPSATTGMTTEERLVLGNAQIAADAAKRHHDRTGQWPKTVTLDA